MTSETPPSKPLIELLQLKREELRCSLEWATSQDVKHFTMMFIHPTERRVYFTSSSHEDHRFLMTVATSTMMNYEHIMEQAKHPFIVRFTSIIGFTPRWYVVVFTDSISANTPVFCLTTDYARFVDLHDFLDEKYFS